MELKKSPGYESLAKAAPVIFDYSEDNFVADPRTQYDFSLSPLAWSLIYLDGLEANLNVIKASSPTMN